MHRTFIAIPVSPEARSSIEALRSQLKAMLSEGGFVFLSDEDLHLTLSFLGDQADEDVGETASALGAVAPMLVFPEEIKFDRVAYLPSAEDPTVIALIADEQSNEQLAQVRDDLENGLLAHEVRFRPDNRAFRAHVTLARRTRDSVLLPEIDRAAQVRFVPEAISFFETRTQKGESRYEVLMSTPIEPVL